MHIDQSRALESEGIRVSFIKAGKHKTVGNPYEPLTEAGANEIQRGVNDFYELFVRAVTRGRNVSTARVQSGFGEGGMVRARGAVNEGMADRVTNSFHDEVSRLVNGPSAGARASSTPPRLSASADFDIELRRRKLLMDDDTPPAPVNRIASYVDREAKSAIEARRKLLAADLPARTDAQRVYTAYHEAGHAVAARAVGLKVYRATIVPDIERNTAGCVLRERAQSGFDGAVVSLAGRYAGRLANQGLAREEDSCSADEAKAEEQLRGYEGHLSGARNRAEEIVRTHFAAVRHVALALIHNDTLSEHDLRAIFREHAI